MAGLNTKMDQQQVVSALALSMGDKSPVVSFLLWFFLGGLGGHRYYLGKVNTGLIMAGLCIAGAVIMNIFVGSVLVYLGYIFTIPLFAWWIYDGYQLYKTMPK